MIRTPSMFHFRNKSVCILWYNGTYLYLYSELCGVSHDCARHAFMKRQCQIPFSVFCLGFIQIQEKCRLLHCYSMLGFKLNSASITVLLFSRNCVGAGKVRSTAWCGGQLQLQWGPGRAVIKLQCWQCIVIRKLFWLFGGWVFWKHFTTVNDE